MMDRLFGRKGRPSKEVTIECDIPDSPAGDRNSLMNRKRAISTPHRNAVPDLVEDPSGSPQIPATPIVDPLPDLTPRDRSPNLGLIPITSESVAPIKRSLARKFNLNVSPNLPLVVQSTPNIAAENLEKRSQESTEKLRTAVASIREANEATAELENLSGVIWTSSTAALADVRAIRTDIEATRKISRDLAGRVLLLVLYIIGLFVGLLNAVTTGVFKLLGITLSTDEATPIPSPPDPKIA
jgi:hypothetical protein